MLRIPRQSYTEEFKREAVKLVEGGIKPAEVARQLGISEQTLGNWRKAKAAGKLVGSGKVVTRHRWNYLGCERKSCDLRRRMKS